MRLAIMVGVLGLVAACGGGGDAEAEPSPDAVGAGGTFADAASGADGAIGPDVARMPADAAPAPADVSPPPPDQGGCNVALGPDAADPLRVGFTHGVARGAESDGVRAWLGLPFAAPPVGEWRFRPPQEPACEAAVRDATAFAPACVQVSKACAQGQPGVACAVEGDEDCLYLNVWRPAGEAAAPRPVLFFIHGGGNAIGATGEEIVPGTRLYDGAALAKLTDAIVVTTAYRLGPFGWAAHPEMALEENGGQSGNFGLLDLNAALGWLHDNLGAVGGDPERVMIFGESAGGVNACMLLAMPQAAGRFQAALIESGGCPAYTSEAVEATTTEMMRNVGCDDLACLRAKSAAELLLALPPNINVAGRNATTYQPHVGDAVLPEAPLEAFAAGRGNPARVMIGANADETAASLPPIPTDAAYEAAAQATFGPLADRVLAQYPAERFASPWEAMMRATTDAKFVCPVRTILRSLVGRETWRYFYTHRLENLQRREPYAQHGIELLFVFQQLRVAGYRPSANEEALAAYMGRAWGAFAGTGEPGWAPWDDATDTHIVLHGGDIHEAQGVRTEDCDFWDSVLP